MGVTSSILDNMIRPLGFVLIGWLLNASPPLAAADSSQARCAVPTVSRYTSAVTLWQQQLAEQIAASKPALIEAAELRATLHSLSLQQQAARFKWLATQAPERLQLQQGISGAVTFDWSETEEQRLRAGEPDYRDLQRKLLKTDAAERLHPKRSALQDFLSDGFLGSSDYQRLAMGLLPTLIELDKELARCASQAPRASRSLTE